MPIQSGDIRLNKSDTMNDTDLGGGQMTKNVIVNGESNNIFEDISTLDRVYGAVKFRKVFPDIHIQTLDKYFGALMIISKLPKDEKIGINLFNSKDWFDRRPAAASRVENYRAQGSKYNGELWETQYTGSKAVTIYQSETAILPDIGQVLYLTQTSDTENQYIKILDYTHSVQEFEDSKGKFYKRILNITISEALKFDFLGYPLLRYTDQFVIQNGEAAKVKNTVVANAAKYYSAKQLATDASIGDTVITVDSIYSQLIPSSLQELSLVDQSVGIVTQQVIDGSIDELNFDFTPVIQANSIVEVGRPVVTNSLFITVSGDTLNDVAGEIRKSNSDVVGSISYDTGTLIFNSDSPTYTGTKVVRYRAGVLPTGNAETASNNVTDANRGFVWNINIQPLPQPKSVRVRYMALGQWYELEDNGSGGIIASDPKIGAGNIDYSTGSVSVTFGALPDVGSEVVYAWGKKSTYKNRSADIVAPIEYTMQLANNAIVPSTLTIAWNDGYADRTATADDQGVITGDAVGRIMHGTGLLNFSPTYTPSASTAFTVDYDHGTPLQQDFGQLARELDGTLLIDLNVSNIVPNSIQMEWNVKLDPVKFKYSTGLTSQPSSLAIFRTDDGSGELNNIVGSIVDYVNGTIQFQPDTVQQEIVYKPVYTTITLPPATTPPPIVPPVPPTVEPEPITTEEPTIDEVDPNTIPTQCFRQITGYTGTGEPLYSAVGAGCLNHGRNISLGGS